MNHHDQETKERIIDRTIDAVRARRVKRVRRRKVLVSSFVLGMVLLIGVGIGRWGKADRPPRVMAKVPELPVLIGVIEEVVPSAWDGEWSLVLVVNEQGMEMKALSDAQVAALARKPGCEFALTPDAVMWVSECGAEGDAFSPSLEF